MLYHQSLIQIENRGGNQTFKNKTAPTHSLTVAHDIILQLKMLISQIFDVQTLNCNKLTCRMMLNNYINVKECRFVNYDDIILGFLYC